MTAPLKIYMIAGEASGDSLGAHLMRALKNQRPDIIFKGVGGPLMMAEGMQSLFPMEELSVMGAAEVLPKLFGILRRIGECADDILSTRPDAVVTIDSPDFCFRVIKKVKAKADNIPFIHYVAPSVWAWRPGRAADVAQFLDHILTLLPFEPPYFEAHHLGATFVGHPIVERTMRGDGDRFRARHGMRPGQQLFCLLPGSRVSEISKLADIFCDTADIILRRRPATSVVIPTLPHLKPLIEKIFEGRGINPIIVCGEEEKFDAFAAATAAIAASGTVSLELALCGTPHVIAYKLNPISAFAARKLIKTLYVNLVNILLQRPAVPELLLEKCAPGPIAKEILALMENKAAHDRQLADFGEALKKIGLGGAETPSEKAAAAVLKAIAEKTERQDAA